MQEQICRGKRIDNGEWVIGVYITMHHNDSRTHIHHFIIPNGSDLSYGVKIEDILVEVDGNTVCRYTEIEDKYCKEIFENDIVEINTYVSEELVAIVKIGQYEGKHDPSNPDKNSHIGLYLDFPFYDNFFRQDIMYWLQNGAIEVLGNVYDNREFLEFMAKKHLLKSKKYGRTAYNIV